MEVGKKRVILRGSGVDKRKGGKRRKGIERGGGFARRLGVLRVLKLKETPRRGRIPNSTIRVRKTRGPEGGREEFATSRYARKGEPGCGSGSWECK